MGRGLHTYSGMKMGHMARKAGQAAAQLRLVFGKRLTGYSGQAGRLGKQKELQGLGAGRAQPQKTN